MRVIPLIVLAIPVAALPVFPQSQRPTFEVASVKPNTSGTTSSRSSSRGNGHFQGTNLTVKSLIFQAYRVQDFQVIGGPDWINTERFDVEARAAEGTMPPPAPPGPPDPTRPEPMALMMQALLEERFQLKAHRETREMPIYSLVVARDGHKLKPTVEGQPGPVGLSSGSSRTSPAPGNNGVQMSGSGIYMTTLAAMLGGQLRRTVMDKTNLPGKFDYTLTWSGSSSPIPALPPAGGDAPTAAEPAGPSIFTAIQEQLGLRLESTRGPVEVIVIDSVQRPSEN
jgi:uncharacterized protein (TIGR03435 family)